MGSSDRGIRLRTAARTNTGQVRENNEDHIHLWAEDEFALAIVADGMGGAAAGEEASQIAVDSVRAALEAPQEHGDRDFLNAMSIEYIAQQLCDAIRTANLRIVERASSNPELRGMGTTVTMVFVRGTEAIFTHVGDSRAYLINGRDRFITQITADHSFVEALVAAGHITHEQAEEHPMRNVLYRALGQSDDIDVDVYETRLRPGDRLLLCSDGLTRHVKPHEIADVVLSDEEPELASEALIDLANSRGGEDNVSVIIILVEATDPERYREQERAASIDDTLVLPESPIIEALKLERSAQDDPEDTLKLDEIFNLRRASLPRDGQASESPTAAHPAHSGEGRDRLPNG